MEREATEMVESATVATFVSRRTVLAGAAGIAGGVALGVVTASPATAAQQYGWRWCNRCQCLFYGDNHTSGWCVVGGGHNWEGSGNYTPHYDYYAGQSKWRWCYRCQSMWYGGDGNNRGHCPASDRHSSDGSGNYSIEYDDHYDNHEQPGWRWCNKCYCLCYSGLGQGYCPSRGRHDFDGSGRYHLPYA
jgi:hypothetical protein